MPPAWAFAARARFAAAGSLSVEGRRAAPSDTWVAARRSGAGDKRRSNLDLVVSRNSCSLSRASLGKGGLAGVAAFDGLKGERAVGLLRARESSSSKPVSKGLRLRRPVSTRKLRRAFRSRAIKATSSCSRV